MSQLYGAPFEANLRTSVHACMLATIDWRGPFSLLAAIKLEVDCRVASNSCKCMEQFGLARHWIGHGEGRRACEARLWMMARPWMAAGLDIARLA